MSFRPSYLTMLCGCLAVAGLFGSVSPAAAQAPEGKAKLDDPAAKARALEVRTILDTHCGKCHGQTKRIKGLNVLDRTSLVDLKRHKNQKIAAVNLEKPGESDLIARARDDMPPEGEGDKIPADKLAIIQRWVEEGAYFADSVPAPASTETTIPSTPPAASVGLQRASVPLAEEVAKLFQDRCSSCHGGSKPDAGFRIMDHPELVAKKLLTPGKKGGKLTFRLEADDSMVMPPVGRGLTRLSEDEVGKIGKWIEQGAPEFDPPIAAQPGGVGHDYVLGAIAQDVQQANAAGTSPIFYRYFSLNHLLGAGITEPQLEQHRKAFVLALNHLTWKPRFVIPIPIEPTRTVFRVDIAGLDWHRAPYVKPMKSGKQVTLWDLILLEYPYGVVFDGSARYQQLQRDYLSLSNQVLPIPYVRADWFVSVATQPPLYEDLLQLPQEYSKLEVRLGVRTQENIANFQVQRAGVTVSGVSRNNRVVERHEPAGGLAAHYFWQSFDFKTSRGLENMFRNPINLNPSGGEMIWGMPNGLQGYYVADNQGNRIDAAPTEIVTDTFASDKIVRNGLACMRCHDAGMRRFKDDVRPAFVGVNTNPIGFSKDDVLALYPDDAKIQKAVNEDGKRFTSAMAQLFAEFATVCPPPTVKNPYQPTGAVLQYVADRYLDEKVTVFGAAAELGLANVEETRTRFRSFESITMGVPQLADGGVVRRDTFEDRFDQIVSHFGIGKPVIPLDSLTRTEYQPETAPFECDMSLNNPTPAGKGKLQVIIVNMTDPKRKVLAAKDKVQFKIVNQCGKDAYCELVVGNNKGKKAVLPGVHLVQSGQTMTYPLTVTVQPNPGSDAITLYASDREFPPGEVMAIAPEAETRGDVVSSRVIHPFYEMQPGLGVRLRYDPARMIRRTFTVETR